jgi:RNA polymerase sigma-70 factor, ECF subfamily
MEITDNEIMFGIQKGDYSCYNRLFIRYYSRLCLSVFKFIGNYSASEDIVQELFVRLWIDREKITISKCVSGYLYQASKNSALNYLRTESIHKKKLDEIPFQEESSDDDNMEQIEFSVALYKCIDQLPARSRQVFLKSRFDGLKQQEISDELGISVKTIKNQIWKSLQFLRACLELNQAF